MIWRCKPRNGLLLLGFIAWQALAAQEVPLEMASSNAWERLRRHVQALSQNPNSPPVRILHLGDSHSASVAFSGRLRELLQKRYGDSGPGFLPPGEVQGHPVSHVRLLQSDGWVSVRDRNKRLSSQGALGGFLAYANRPYQAIGYKLPGGNRDARLLVYTDPASQDQIKVFHDDHEVPPLTRSAQGRTFFSLKPGQGRLVILANGVSETARLRGVTLLHETPGVTYSVVGVNGARLNILQEWRGETLRTELNDYQPDLLIVAFGTNDAVPGGYAREKFAEMVGQTERWLADYAPQAAVLLLLPPPVLNQAPAFKNNLEEVRLILRQTARKNGWSVWDWSRSVENYLGLSPSIYAKDGIHLTAQGYTLTAKQLYQALQASF